MKINPNNLMRADTTRSNVLPGNGRGRAGALAPTLFKKNIAALEYSARRIQFQFQFDVYDQWMCLEKPNVEFSFCQFWIVYFGLLIYA